MTKIIAACFFLIILVSCDLFKKSNHDLAKNKSGITSDTSVKINDSETYHPSAKRINDIIHTKLDVKFDWDKTYLYGKASITAKPYYYPTDKLDLDARGMDIHEVQLIISDSSRKKLDYSYENNILSIKLDKTYQQNEIYTIYIDYTSKPNELDSEGSKAIKNDKGLYFINPDGKEKNKPRQIWTQGETQANSCWFPTIDHPNEKMTHDIYITIDKKYTTLSNGELVFSTDNSDNTRTDYWKMELPHSPYLVMMAIGEYAVVNDSWKDKEISYYVEKEYEPHARAIFGDTPEMLDFYSDLLGVPYPWNKYSQVVVRDYVSGAMENTTATIHGEFLQQTERELLDKDHDNIIAHELFHQWFGDLVTCESWANLPLNESFANYGEYLWMDYKLGKDEADRHMHAYLNGYLREAATKQVDLIRYNYTDREDMFDSHSYNKGGIVLHRLRYYVGDEAFFAALKLYLETNKFNTVEIHNLRLAFEKVTGEDLNWFFDQWFLSSGHPQLAINCSYNPATKKETVNIKQTQDTKNTPVFKLHTVVDIYYNGKKDRYAITISKTNEDFVFEVPEKPDLVNVDAEKIFLGTKEENKTTKELIFQYHNAPFYMDRYEALNQLAKTPKDSLAAAVLLKGVTDPFWYLRSFVIKNGLKQILTGREKAIKEKLIVLAQQDQKSNVRAAAINFLSENYKEEDLISLYKNATNDQSYLVMSEALSAMAKVNKEEGMTLAKKYEKEKNMNILFEVAQIYAESGNDENNDFFMEMYEKLSGHEYINFCVTYADFLKKCSDQTINKGILLFEKMAEREGKLIRLYAQNAMKDLADNYLEKQKKLSKKIKSLKSADPADPKIKEAELELEQANTQEKKIRDLYNNYLKEEEKNK